MLPAAARPAPGWTHRGRGRRCDPPAHRQSLGRELVKGFEGPSRDSRPGRFALLTGFSSCSHCSQKPSGCHCCPLQGNWKPTSSSFPGLLALVPLAAAGPPTGSRPPGSQGSTEPLPHQRRPGASPQGPGARWTPGMGSLGLWDPSQAPTFSARTWGQCGGEEEVGCPGHCSSPTASDAPEQCLYLQGLLGQAAPVTARHPPGSGSPGPSRSGARRWWPPPSSDALRGAPW